MTRTAVVILNFNGEKLLPKFLPSVIRHTMNAEIIIADNASTDASLQIVKENFPSVRIISLDRNYGFCGGYNRALSQVSADYYVLLNSDVEVTEHWLEPMTELLDTNRVIAAVQPKILSYHLPDTFEYAGAAGGFIDLLAYPFCRGRIFNTLEKDHGQYNDVRPVFWATGACIMIRSSVYHKFGGLDEDFFAHMEEIDLCWKIHRAGLQVFYCGKSTVYHVGAGTLGYESPRKTYLNFRNGLSLIVKHFTTTEILYKLPLRILLDWLAAAMYLLKGETKNFKAVWIAHAHFLKNIGRDYRKRKHIKQFYPAYSRATVYKRSIVLDYFFRKKKYFDGSTSGREPQPAV